MGLGVFILILLNILMLVTGQLLWKNGIEQSGFGFSLPALAKLILNPYIIGGFLIYIAATLLWFYILSKTQLSTAYPMQSLCYVVTALVSLFLFKENIALVKWAGLFLITLGAFLVSRG